MDLIREEYFKYLESVLIPNEESIEPETSRLEFVKSLDENWKPIYFSPLLGKRVRVSEAYYDKDEQSKNGHIIGHKTDKDGLMVFYVLDIVNKKVSKIGHSSECIIIDNNKILSLHNKRAVIYDFDGNIIEERNYEQEIKELKKYTKHEKKPRREGINCDISKGLFGAKYTYKGITLDFKPILDYDGNLICYKDGNIYLYNSLDTTIKFLCPFQDFDYTYNAISIKDKRYMLFNGKLIDVTDYPDVDNYVINSKLEEVLSFEEFKKSYESDPEHKRKLEELKQKNDLILEAKKQEELKQKIQDNSEATQKEIIELYKKYLDLIDASEALGDNNPLAGKKTIPITESVLFIDKIDHREINPFFLDNHLLRYADLSMIDFSNVKLDHIDCLAYTNANINPQTVYNKDLSYCDLRGVYHTMDDFSGVNMEETIVDKDKIDFASELGDGVLINDKKLDSRVTSQEARELLREEKKRIE